MPSLITLITESIQRHEYLALLSFLFLEELGVPLPVPGDVIMVLAGVQSYEGKMNPLLALVSLEIGTIIGSSILYWVARIGGHPLLMRFGRYIGLTQSRVDKVEGWLARHGPLAIVIGRLTPGLRIPTSIMCGVLEEPYRVFLPFMALGSLIYISVFFVLGLVLGPEVLQVLRRLALFPTTTLVFIAGALMVTVTVVLVLLRRKASTGSD